MPLTPDEVVARTFQPTKFREGYDQAEVDDFLDEVVAELRRLNAENDELRSKLATAEKRCAELSRAASGSAPQQNDRASVAAVARPAITDQRQLSSAAHAGEFTSPQRREAEPTPDVTTMTMPATASHPVASQGSAPFNQAAPFGSQNPAADSPFGAGNGSSFAAAAGGGLTMPPGAMAGATPGGTQEAAGMLALAQRLHDEHVRTGERERDRLIGEAKSHADRMVSDAERKKTETLTMLERERAGLERRIDELKVFEREYRSRLKAYLESQMRDLDNQPSVIPGRPPHEVAAARG